MANELVITKSKIAFSSFWGNCFDFNVNSGQTNILALLLKGFTKVSLKTNKNLMIGVALL